ncbi:V-type ATP synthase subunit E family protein [Oscillospiraceae bacterium PP1C4]
MTGLEKIVKQIQDEVQQAADIAIAQAKADAAKIDEQAKADGAAQSAAITAQAKADAQNCLAAAKSAAALATRRAVLSAKQQIISSMIVEAQKSFYELPDDQYFALILKMVERFSLPQSGEIVFSASDLKRLPFGFEAALAKAAQGTLTISKETRTIDGGFILVYGGVEENCSIEALFYAARERLQDKVQQLLFA